MQEERQYDPISRKQIGCAILLLGIASLIEGASDWVEHGLAPALTLAEILRDSFALLALRLVIGVPIAMLLWNKLLSPIFELRAIRYVHGLAILAVAFFLSG